MKDLFRTERDYLIRRGYLYLPLLHDPQIAAELNHLTASEHLFRADPHDPPSVEEYSGNTFVKSLHLLSWLENYPLLFPQSLKGFRTAWLQAHAGDAAILQMVNWDETFATILFQILPHFMKKNKLTGRRRYNEQQVLDRLVEKLPVPARYSRYAAKLTTSPPSTTDALQQLRQRVVKSGHELPADGLYSGRELQEWLASEMAEQALSGIRQEVERAIGGLRALLGRPVEHVALLLYLMDKGTFEVDGFGFQRIGSGPGYTVFKHTGDYALKDYYGRLYLFPDCRVAVVTDRLLKPVVLEKYKHPFLLGFAAGQEICLGNETHAEHFSARAAIEAIEAGIGTLFYGYNSRQRNGYHSLDSTNMYVRGVGFDEYRIPKDHDKIVTGRVEIKNAYF